MMGIWRIRICFSNELALPPQGRWRGMFSECVSEVNKALERHKICCEEVNCDVLSGNSIKHALDQRQQGEARALVACEKAVREVLERNEIEVDEGQIIVKADKYKPASG